MWTQFMDMHSGGGQKLNWAYIYIEAAEAEAEVIFYNRFGRNPNRVTCTCCGPDYSISSEESLVELTGYQRGCAYAYVMEDGSEKSDNDWYALPREERIALNARGRYVERGGDKYKTYRTLDEYMKDPAVTFIPATHIKPEERRGTPPAEGYVWAGDD